MRAFRAVIFDMDGVLVDSEPLHWKVDKVLMQGAGIPVTEQDFIEATGRSDTDFLFHLQKKYAIANLDILKLLRERHSILTDAVRDHGVTPIEGVEEVVTYAAKHFSCAVASSSPHSFIDAVLETLHLGKYLHTRVSAHDLPAKRGKPNPDIYLLAAEKLKMNPKDCIAIEDAMHGVAAAKAAGMQCISFARPEAPKQDLSSANVVATSMEEILQILKECSNRV